MDDLDEAQERLGKALDRARAGEDRELTARVRDDGEHLVRLLYGALRMTRILPLSNHAFDAPVSEMQAVLARLLDLLGLIHVLAVEDQVYVNDIRVRLDERAGLGAEIGAMLRRLGVGGLSFHAAPDVQGVRDLVACLGAPPDPVTPRTALREALRSHGLEMIDVAGIYRFRVTGEDQRASIRPVETVTSQAAELLEETWDNMAANRLPNPLPLRRIVTELLELGRADARLESGGAGTSYTAHVMRVTQLALRVGAEAGLPDALLQDLGLAAMFHDVGYAAREGAVAARDGDPGHPGYAPPFARHPAAGARLLLRQRGFHEAKVRRVLAVLEHHRDYADPRGRPSLFGRILRLVEDYDTMTHLGGQARVAPPEAVGQIAAGAGTRYDPLLTQVLVNVLGKHPPGTRLLLEDGRLVRSVSLTRNPERFDLPVTVVERDAEGRIPAQHALVDLAIEGAVRRVLPAVGADLRAE